VEVDQIRLPDHRMEQQLNAARVQGDEVAKQDITLQARQP
jgi:hypothetical protein